MFDYLEAPSLPSPHTLTIEEHEPDEPDGWGMLHVPSLINLTSKNDAKNLSCLMPMIERSKCTIKGLHFEGSSLEWIVRIIRELPDVKEICLVETRRNAEILTHLVWNSAGNEERFLSSLRKIKLHVMPGTTLHGAALSSSVSLATEGQASALVPLRSVKYDAIVSWYDPSVVQVCNSGEELGIEVEVVRW